VGVGIIVTEGIGVAMLGGVDFDTGNKFPSFSLVS
jgi:hypothetical protein